MINLNFKTLVDLITKYSVDKCAAEQIASDILDFHPCGDCIYYGDCKDNYEDCEYAFEYPSAAREKAASILEDFELYGDFYYTMEDWLTNKLSGDDEALPYQMESEYLKCALRVEIRNYFEGNDFDYTNEDIETVVDNLFDSFSESVLNQDFIESEVNKFMDEREVE